jgi:hypothetical protein
LKIHLKVIMMKLLVHINLEYVFLSKVVKKLNFCSQIIEL